MIKIRSSTIFRLLCGAIGLFAAALLAMVGLMVYPFVFPVEDGPAAKTAERKPPAERVRHINVKTAASTWQDRFWPEVPDQTDSAVGQAQEAEGDFIYIGSMIIDDHNSSAIFQRKSSREQFRVPMGGEVYDIALKEVAPDQVVATIAGNLVALRKVNTLPPKGAKRTAARPGARTSTTRNVNTSFRLAESRTNSGPTRATAVRSSRNGKTSRTPAPSSSTTNWRRYWAERMRSRQQNTNSQRR